MGRVNYGRKLLESVCVTKCDTIEVPFSTVVV